MAEDILKRLRADTATVNAVRNLVSMHRDIPKNEVDIKFILKRISEKRAEQLLGLMIADSASKKVGKGEDEGLLLMKELLRKVIESQSCYSLDALAIGGGELLKAGYQGREIGRALENALDAVIEGRIKNNKKDILDYLKKDNNGGTE
jgi:tRNA nucleotidyltransferase (CCA-adding enzyme)